MFLLVCLFLWPAAQFSIGTAGRCSLLVLNLAAYLAASSGKVLGNVAFFYFLFTMWTLHGLNL